MTVGFTQAQADELRAKVREAIPDAKLDPSDPRLPDAVAIAAHLTGRNGTLLKRRR